MLATFLVAIFVFGCQTQDTPVANIKIPGILKISFDAEVLRFQELVDPAKATSLQIVSAAAKWEK